MYIIYIYICSKKCPCLHPGNQCLCGGRICKFLQHMVISCRMYFRKKGKATDLVKGAVIETLFSPPQHTLTSAKNLYFWHPIRCGHTRGHREDSLINKTFESAIFVETHLQHIQLISQMNDHAPQSETRSLLPAVAMVQHCDVAMRKMPERNSAFSGTPDMIHVVDMLQLPHCENEFKNCN